MKKNIMQRVGLAALTYVIIYVLAVVLAVFSVSVRESGSAETGAWDVVQFFVFPALFFGAGCLVTAKCELPKLNARRVLLAAVCFGGVLLGLWYLSLEASVMLNLPVAQGCYALDHWLRKINIVYKYEYTYLAKTDMYRYVTLPLLYFVLDVLYWMCYLWGNRFCVTKRTPFVKKK